jgi:hypothetical protein
MIGPKTTLNVVQGATLTRALQGYNEDGTIPNTFLDSDTLTGTVFLAPSTVAVVSFTPTWFNAGFCQVIVNLTDAQTASLSSDTQYNLQVFATRSGVTYCTHWVYLQVDIAAGSQVYTGPPDLITLEYAASALAIFPLTPAQFDFLPAAISAASAAIRRWCGDRVFTRMTFVKDFAVIQGQIRLDQFPVNQVIRAQTQPVTAMTVVNQSSSVQTAQVLFTYTGTSWGVQVVTGLTLNWVSNGTPATASVPYTSNMTLNGLVTAINAVGSGWSAQAPAYGAWPVTELIGGFIGKGATGGGAQLTIFSVDMTGALFFPDNGQLVGMVNVGQQFPATIGPSWGPDWPIWDYPTQGGGIVRVTYNAGFQPIPDDIQEATAEAAKMILVRLLIDPYLQSEQAAHYSYTNAFLLWMWRGLPQWVKDIISLYRIHNA